MKKKILTLILAATMALSFTACGDLSTDNEKETTTETKEEPVEESVLDDYTQKTKDETPALVEEYGSDAGCCGGY